MNKENFITKKSIKNIIIAFFAMVFLVLALLCFNYSNKLIVEKKAEEEVHFDYLREVKEAHLAISQGEKIKIMEGSKNDYIGTGIIFSINNNIVFITEVIKGSPADKAGIKADDRIIKIDEKYVIGMTVNDVSNALMGESGTNVTLNIYRDLFNGYSKNFVITRDLIDNSERRQYYAFLTAGMGGEELGSNYYLYDGKVYYWHDGGGQAVPLMDYLDINPDEFKIIDTGCIWDKERYKFNICDSFIKDTKKVFCNSYELEGASPDTFELISKRDRNNLSRDNSYVFYGNIKIENADLDTFKVLSDNYEKDKEGVYFKEWEIKGADPTTFRVVSDKNALAKDKNNFFIGTEKVNESEFEKMNR